MNKFSDAFDTLYQVFFIVSYFLEIVGIALILYGILMFALVTFTLLKLKNINTLKVIHALSITEVYAFICLLMGILFVSKIYGLLTLKILLFGIIVIFNGITVTRLIAKTYYFHNLNSKEKDLL
jgi:hypothetical protein